MGVISRYNHKAYLVVFEDQRHFLILKQDHLHKKTQLTESPINKVIKLCHGETFTNVEIYLDTN